MIRPDEPSPPARRTAVPPTRSARGIARWACVLLLVAAGRAIGRDAEPAQVRRTPAPAWVERFAPDLAPSTAAGDNRTDGDSVHFLVRDEQIHAAEGTTYRHYALRFLSQDGVQDHSTLSFSFDPAYQDLRLHQLVVHRDGRAIDRLPRQEIKILQREPNLEDQLYDGRSTATLILEDIRVGDVVEYAYSVHGTNPIFAGHFADTFPAAWRDPLPQWRERLLWPANRPLPVIQNHGATCVPKIRALADGRTTEFRWEADNLPGRLPESDTPSWVDTYGWVQVSDFTSWQEVARWSARLFAQAAPDPRQGLPEELRRTVDTLRALPDRPSQVIGALRYVQDNYRYLGIEIGANSHQPYPVATVCDRRFGDCKDKANLLATLLRLLGFEADPALVDTGYRHAIADWHPTPFAFDHAVVRLRLDGATYWLDATREHQGGTLGHVFFPDYGKALVVNEHTRELADVLPGAFEDTRSEITDTYQQQAYTGPATLAVRTVLHGRHADRTRGYFASTNREKIERDYLNFYARQHPKIRALDRVGFADDRDRNEIVIDERYEVSDLWVRDSDPSSKRARAAFEAPELKDCIDLPGTRLRTLPFDLIVPEHMTQTIRLRLPGGVDLTPRHIEIKDQAFAFTYTSRLEADQKSLLLTYQYQALADHVEAARMPEYLLHADQALDQLGYTLSIDNQKLVAAPAAPARRPAVEKTEPAAPTVPSFAPLRFPWLGMALLPLAFAVVYLQRVLPRRAVLASAEELPPPLPLHLCAVCGRTEQQHPELDFRVGADGQDYCTDHSRSTALRAGI